MNRRRHAFPVAPRYPPRMTLELRYPRSFRKLLALGLTLVAVPLAIGLIGNAVSIRTISEQSVQAVYQASRLTQASRALAENLTAQERAVRQHQVLEDAALWEAYEDLHRRFAETVETLSGIALAEAHQAQLAAVVASENRLYADLSMPPALTTPAERVHWRASVVQRFAALSEAAQAMLARHNDAIGAEIEQLRTLAASAERTMLVQLLALLPVAVFLVFGFTRLLAGPIAELEAAIGRLRAGRFAERIEVGGPSDLQALGDELDRLRLRLVQLEDQKSRFLRHISHELKTPLTALREGADLLAEGAAGPLTETQREIVDILTDNSLRLRQLIEDLLSWSAADFEQAALRLQRFPLKPLLEAVIERQRLAWQARGLTVAVTTEDLALDADRERIRTVLDNLLSNAVKFSPPGGVITVRTWREAGEIQIEVADQGPGVAESDRERIFDPFFQGRHQADGPVKGSGLGLSIAQEQVLAHRGRLAVLPGPGGRFLVSLPVE